MFIAHKPKKLSPQAPEGLEVAFIKISLRSAKASSGLACYKHVPPPEGEAVKEIFGTLSGHYPRVITDSSRGTKHKTQNMEIACEDY